MSEVGVKFYFTCYEPELFRDLICLFRLASFFLIGDLPRDLIN